MGKTLGPELKQCWLVHFRNSLGRIIFYFSIFRHHSLRFILRPNISINWAHILPIRLGENGKLIWIWKFERWQLKAQESPHELKTCRWPINFGKKAKQLIDNGWLETSFRFRFDLNINIIALKLKLTKVSETEMQQLVATTNCILWIVSVSRVDLHSRRWHQY